MENHNRLIRCALITLAFLPGILLSQASDLPWLNYWTPDIGTYFKVDDTIAVPLVRDMNRYHVMMKALYLTHQIEDAADNRIYLEFHATGGAVYNEDDDELYPEAFISFKVNLMNPKIPNSHEISTNINELRNLASLTGFSLPQDAAQRVDGIETRLRKYHTEHWWKRLSLAASIPFSSDGHFPSFEYDQTFLCLGYDLGDILTLQVGANLKKRFMAAASVDLSTPLYSLAENFKNAVAEFLRVPRGGRSYGGYQ